MTILAGQIPTAAELNALANVRLVARARRTTTSTTTTTEIGVLRLDDIAITSGLCYKIEATAHLDSSVANDIMKAHIRYTTDGSTPTTSSSVLPGSGSDGLQANASFGETRIALTDYTPAGDETLSLLLCVVRLTGTGNASIHADGTTYLTNMYVTCMGTDPGDTGTDI